MLVAHLEGLGRRKPILHANEFRLGGATLFLDGAEYGHLQDGTENAVPSSETLAVLMAVAIGAFSWLTLTVIEYGLEPWRARARIQVGPPTKLVNIFERYVLGLGARDH